jgi:hypothetical protein
MALPLTRLADVIAACDGIMSTALVLAFEMCLGYFALSFVCSGLWIAYCKLRHATARSRDRRSRKARP